jgi:hypothetical protein
MPLIGPGSVVADAVLETLVTEHVEGIREMVRSLEAPARPVLDGVRLALAREFAADALALLEKDGAFADRAGRIRRVNLSYEVMLILVDYLKTYTGGPTVPRPRAAPRPGPD